MSGIFNRLDRPVFRQEIDIPKLCIQRMIDDLGENLEKLCRQEAIEFMKSPKITEEIASTIKFAVREAVRDMTAKIIQEDEIVKILEGHIKQILKKTVQ